MIVRLSRQWFNPLYFHLKKYAEDPTIRKIMVYGGKSSAKTFSIGQFVAIKGFTENCSSILYRKEQATIKITLKPALVKAVDSIRFGQVYNTMDFRLLCHNGHNIVFKGLDEEGKVKGIEGFKYLLFDELDHFTEEEWRQANLSLRGIPNQKLFATWNPVDERSWIKKEIDSIEWEEQPNHVEGNPYSTLSQNSFVMRSKDGKTVLIRTNYYDNKWITGGDGYGYRDENLIFEYEALSVLNPNAYRVNVLGEWGKPDVQSPYVSNFSHEKHVKECHFNPNLPVYFSLDFNVEPMVCICSHDWRDSKGVLHHHIFQEIVLQPATLLEMIQKIKGAFPASTLATAFYTGDATGNKRNIYTRNNASDWKILQQGLNISSNRLRVPKSNPSVSGMRNLINLYFSIHPDLKINPSCKTLINELMFTECDAEGNILKKDRNKMEQRADALDTLRYHTFTFHHDFEKREAHLLRGALMQ